MIVAIKSLRIQLIQSAGSLNIGATVNIVAQPESVDEEEQGSKPIPPSPIPPPQPVVPTSF